MRSIISAHQFDGEAQFWQNSCMKQVVELSHTKTVLCQALGVEFQAIHRVRIDLTIWVEDNMYLGPGSYA
ncbi:unnamed protein product [Protopolystoma xenopodis]|uniref:Uncharacterized protein n=1 Tax=Protopolystoma xenopodis TaxID=117903 RepID=A0A3S5AVI1_9PLAT|nr:unnamed protein product [Protopolystoma xenopodis]